MPPFDFRVGIEWGPFRLAKSQTPEAFGLAPFPMWALVRRTADHFAAREQRKCRELRAHCNARTDSAPAACISF